MADHGKYRYNSITDSLVIDENTGKLVQLSDFTTVRMSDIENACTELNSLKEELEVYKKALEIACEEIDVICQSYKTVEECKKCPFTCRHADLVESYLMKAREQK